MARWRVRLSFVAEQDFAEIVGFTVEQFGVRQARIYQSTLTHALGALHAGPSVTGSRARDEIMPGLRSLHVAREGRRGRHFVLFRPGPEQTIEVLRILHDAMDLSRHLSKD